MVAAAAVRWPVVAAAVAAAVVVVAMVVGRPGVLARRGDAWRRRVARLLAGDPRQFRDFGRTRPEQMVWQRVGRI